jgi:hypothetical protein
MRRISVIFPLLFLGSPAIASDKIDVDKAVEQAKIVAKALIDEDYAKVADLTHSKVVELMGGREKMIAQTKAIVQAMKDQGIEIKTHTVGKPDDPVVDGKTAYLVISTRMTLTVMGKTLETESYLLGTTTDSGKSWMFVDGAGMDRSEFRHKIFPKLPDGLKLPQRKPPVVKD